MFNMWGYKHAHYYEQCVHCMYMYVYVSNRAQMHTCSRKPRHGSRIVLHIYTCTCIYIYMYMYIVYYIYSS